MSLFFEAFISLRNNKFQIYWHMQKACHVLRFCWTKELFEDCLNIDNDAPVHTSLTVSEMCNMVMNKNKKNEIDNHEDEMVFGMNGQVHKHYGGIDSRDAAEDLHYRATYHVALQNTRGVPERKSHIFKAT
ncbi:hypothetical protein scyTo_0006338 [Scyliorhinus torazame]|uniref:Uncharacterized protein n=1 Tax=Scyliorhinus torazame TaxID=75743 RepID=A0A401PH94_SCYTO|nr:hypothetical protein [Scyliorhinus torazame]